MSHPSFETLYYNVENGIATLALNRPGKMNAFTPQMRDDLVAAFDATDADDAVRVVIVTGAGRAFCAGADLSVGGKTFDASYNEGMRAPSAMELTCADPAAPGKLPNAFFPTRR
jgi:enoyl-CoA hydratase/carnithine racemase